MEPDGPRACSLPSSTNRSVEVDRDGRTFQSSLLPGNALTIGVRALSTACCSALAEMSQFTGGSYPPAAWGGSRTHLPVAAAKKRSAFG